MKQQVLTIALSDNNASDLTKLSQTLSMVGYFVCLSSPNAKEMIDGLRTMSDPPYLCIITINDEATDLLGTCEAIKTINEDIKIIIQSRTGIEENAIVNAKFAPNTFCRKDIAFPKELLESIRDLFKDQIVIVEVTGDHFEFIKLVE